jgi:hypothetical protein
MHIAMSDIEQQLRQLVIEACKHPPGSLDRQRNLTKIIRLITKKLWQERTSYYPDALQQTWIYFCQNVCEKGTGRQYDPDRGTIITWLNAYLKRRLQDFYTEAQKDINTRAVGYTDKMGEILDPLDRVAASPDVPPILDEMRAWAEADANGELRHTHIQGRADVSCQFLILRRLPPETTWKVLSKEVDLPIPTLSAFYQRKCLPLLRKFGESEGYVEGGYE